MIFPINCPDLMITDACNMRCQYCFEKHKDNNFMSTEDALEYFKHNPSKAIFTFGGEPLMNIDIVCRIIDKIKVLRMSQKRKKKFLEEARKLITNGTLIKQNLEKIKLYQLHCQISLDGDREANNQRVYPNGKETFDDVMEAVKLCDEEDISWALHGVVTQKSLEQIFNIFKFYFETYCEYRGVKKAINSMGQNNFQIIFEENYSDDDIKTLKNEFRKIFIYIMNADLKLMQKLNLFKNFFEKEGGVCSVGTSLLAVDYKNDIYPCHRLALKNEKEEYKLGNWSNPKEFKNFKLYNSLYNLNREGKYMYSAYQDIFYGKGKNPLSWFMWCPATNIETSGTPYYQNVKYNALLYELKEYIKKLKEKYIGNGNSDGQQSSCVRC